MKQTQIKSDFNYKKLMFDTINKLGHKLQSFSDSSALLGYVAQEVIGPLGFDGCTISSVDFEKNTLRRLAAFEPENQHYDQISNNIETPIAPGIITDVIQTTLPIVIGDQETSDIETTLSEICVPITVNRKLFGVIHCADSRPQHFGQKHLETLTMIASIMGAKLHMLEVVRLAKQRAEELHHANEQLSKTIAECKVVEKKLVESERRFQDLANSGSDWYWEQDEQLKFTEVSAWRNNYCLAKFAQNAIGRTRWEVLGVNLDDNKYWKQHFEDLQARKSFRDFKYDVVDEGGKTLTFSIGGTPVFTEDGEFKGYRGTAAEITELIETQNTNNRFINAIDQLSLGFVLWDADEKLVLCNARMQELSGLPSDFLVPGLTFESWVTERVRLGLAPELEEEGDNWLTERIENFRNPSGSQEVLRNGRWYLVRFVKLSDGGTMQVVTDINDIKLSENRFELATKVGGIGVWETSLDGSKSIWSDSAYAVFGLNPGDVQPSIDSFLNMVHIDDQEAVGHAVRNARKFDQDYSFECRVQHKNGTYIWVVCNAKTINFNGVTLWSGIIRNINKQKRADLVKNEFVSTMSHELRTPLTAICGSIDLLLAGVLGELGPEASRMLSVCKDNSSRLLMLVGDLLEFDKLEAGKLIYNLAPLSHEKLLLQASEINAPFAKKYNSRIKILPKSDLFYILADENRIQQIFSNLISNAVKFSPEDSEVVLSATKTGKFGVFTVKDSGAGISREFEPKLFDRFTQADSSDTRTAGGTGLGLAITKLIIEDMGGSITFETEIGVGTTFSFALPLNSPQNCKHLLS